MKQTENKQGAVGKNILKETEKAEATEMHLLQAKMQLVQRIELFKKLYNNSRKWR